MPKICTAIVGIAWTGLATSHSAMNEEEGKGKDTKAPWLLVQRAAVILALRTGSLGLPCPLGFVPPIRRCIAAEDFLLWLASLLGKKWQCLHTKICSFLNNVTAPILDCILNLAGVWGRGSCYSCTRSWCQLNPWHWGGKAPPQPWEVLFQASR